MTMAKLDTKPGLARFAADEQGAVTVDWIVLTGSIVLLGVGASFYVTSTVPKVANAITTYMDDHEIGDE
jgi:Flp pilus assembly pilin Flp